MLSAGRDLSRRGSSHLLTASSSPPSTIVSARAVLRKSGGISAHCEQKGEDEHGRTSASDRRREEASLTCESPVSRLGCLRRLARRRESSLIANSQQLRHSSIRGPVHGKVLSQCQESGRGIEMGNSPLRPEPSSSFHLACSSVSQLRRSSHGALFVVLKHMRCK